MNNTQCSYKVVHSGHLVRMNAGKLAESKSRETSRMQEKEKTTAVMGGLHEERYEKRRMKDVGLLLGNNGEEQENVSITATAIFWSSKISWLVYSKMVYIYWPCTFATVPLSLSFSSAS